MIPRPTSLLWAFAGLAPLGAQAALCVEALGSAPGSEIVVSGSSIEDCAEFVLLDATEYQALTESPTLADIFTMPVAEDLGQMWAVGFSLPIIIYLTAWALGVVVNNVNR